MEPRIQYAKTSDGVNIAYTAVGEGLPFVWPAGMVSLDEIWRLPELREIVEGISRQALFVSYNTRGFGLSDRDTVDFSCEAMVRDLEAVADAIGIERFTLQVWSMMAIPAVVFAERHPERLFALILLNGIMRGADRSPEWESLLQIAAQDWELGKRLLVQSNEAGYALTTTLEENRKALDRSISRDSLLAFHRESAAWDASELVGRVGTPALVAHYGELARYTPLEASRRLAASLPNGSFASVVPTDGEQVVDAASRVVRGFLRGVLPRSESRRVHPQQIDAPSGTAIILFADIADSTALTETLGDTAFRAKARELDAALRTIIRDHSGTPIEGKLLGDGVLATFTSARQAIEAALASARSGDDAGLPLHLGLHAGDVIREEGNVFGGAVNIAARVSALAAPGEVLVSETIRSLARTSAGVRFEDRGEREMKGVGEPVRVWAVRGGA
jgi:class 3 adenylate cyclase/pimeloyl-ACP methyl ester carboxylesterase